MRVTPEMIASLRGKYREIKRLRDEHAAGRVLLSDAPHDPKPEMAALARRFPGALRELDELPMSEIESRLALLEHAARTGEAPQWVALQLAYHGTFRVLLGLKRAVGGAAKAGRLEALLEAARALRESADAEDRLLLAEIEGGHGLGPEGIALLLKPAGGRLHPLVLSQAARICGVSSDEVARSLFLRERVLVPEAGATDPPCVPPLGTKS
jgi:hypothetical protein